MLSKLPKYIHKLNMRTAKSMSKFFFNIADKNACFLINCKILVTRDTEKQTRLLVDYHTHNRTLKENSLCKTEKENLLICSLTINGNETETKVKES